MDLDGTKKSKGTGNLDARNIVRPKF